MKRCTGCQIEKSLWAFEPHATGRDGLRGRCRTCTKRQRSEYHAKWYGFHTAKKAAQGAAYYRSTPRSVLRVAVKNALKRHPSTDPITTDYAMALWAEQNGRCSLSGIQMTWASGKGGPQPTSVSIDRIRTDRPYEKGNIRLCCFAINLFRGQMSDGDLFLMLRQFYNHVFRRKSGHLPKREAA